ncbi:threonylcarbamoyladenosine tRNA methylthiotransferase MtaB [Anaerocolumna jejuensis DSM 15929]|uniref:Threonylcarbamoyladenosine tRNA methylthiotransferase MtaB n=1 Tax=Anaerocolumna jejuensis DSM 15929 TaxID=1121322 RepID=A0A1M6KXR5_9FIRM|nr:tRNA (N(6)-L-threonylcarbamoyladenosine(37)-C(2))-methylthiotransferase MtaB [Anaerocolumna jejuensis]SHJ63646.1 threonylcarbamoyladenosine tRNA methylthiotransferase MtaB [Anaerocolumna jejuensis DSM 15929]
MEIQMNRDDKLKTAAFLTLGCKVNSYETEGIKKLFEEDGFQVVEFHEKADVYVVNTCTVTNIADRKSRQMLHKARKMNEDAIVMAVGCYAQAAGEQLKEDEAIDIVVGNNRKKDIIKILKAYIDDNTIDSIIDVSKPLAYEELEIADISEKTRAYIKIQDGCNQFCSYCIIPYARGRVRSRGTESIMKEAKHLVDRGYKEIVLTGIHLSSYGIDIDNISISENHHLLDLITELDALEGLERIRLGSLEPRIVTEDFVKGLAALRTFCPHFHLSLQSGCDRTLERMNRKYTTGEYYEKCCLIRRYFENPAITTDVIVGFPGETEEEFQQTKEFLQKIDFSQMHIFKFSPRKGTKAALMPEQVKEEMKAERSNILLSLEEEMAKNYRKLFIGRTERLLVEEEVEIDGIKYQTGHNERYLKLAVKSEENLANNILFVAVKEFLNKEMMICESMD